MFMGYMKILIYDHIIMVVGQVQLIVSYCEVPCNYFALQLVYFFFMF